MPYLVAMGRGGTAYAVLGVEPDADADALKRGYRRRARETHPDHGGSVSAFATVRDLYEMLADPARRAEYDARARGVWRQANPDPQAVYTNRTPWAEALRRRSK